MTDRFDSRAIDILTGILIKRYGHVAATEILAQLLVETHPDYVEPGSDAPQSSEELPT